MFKKRGFFKCLLFLVIFFLKFSTIFHRSHMKTSSLKVTRENILCFSSTNTSGILYHYTSDSYATRQWQNIAEENWKLFLISLVVSLLLPKRMQDVFSVNKRYVLWSPSSGVVKTGRKRRRETLPRYSRKCSRNPANFLLNLSVTSLQTFPRNEGKKKNKFLIPHELVYNGREEVAFLFRRGMGNGWNGDVSWRPSREFKKREDGRKKGRVKVSKKDRIPMITQWCYYIGTSTATVGAAPRNREGFVKH